MESQASDAALNSALLIVRLTLAWVFLYAAWKNTENLAAWTWTKNETALLFASLNPARRDRVAALAAAVGMVMMYGGGLSVLTGVMPRVGGLAIALFSALGMRIHALRRDEAKRAGESGNAMGWSAFSAHVAAGLKNWALIGAALLIVIVGTGSYSIGPDLGKALVARIFE